MPRGPSRPYPSVPLSDALQLPIGIRDHNAGRPMNRILLAEALGWSPASSGFRDVVTAANRFELINGNYNSDTLALTPLGEAAVRGESEEQKLDSLRQAMEKIALFKKLLEHFENNRLPSTEILKGILENAPFNVSSDWSAEAAQVFVATGRFTGVIRDMSGGNPYVIREAGPPVDSVPDSVRNEDGLNSIENRATLVPDATPGTPAAPEAFEGGTAAQSTPRQFFIAHGRDTTALGQLQSILKGFEIPYVVAGEEANAGRPISQKIADLIRACSAGIFIFSGDDEVIDNDGQTVLRPRQNVVYELGAASFQYGQRIVIFKEKGVEFPTDFRDLGYIEYEKDNLSAKAMELLKELINLKALKVTAGG